MKMISAIVTGCANGGTFLDPQGALRGRRVSAMAITMEDGSRSATLVDNDAAERLPNSGYLRSQQGGCSRKEGCDVVDVFEVTVSR